MHRIDFVRAVTEGTLLPISLVIVFMGGVVWLTTLYAKTEANAAALQKIEFKQDQYLQNLEKILQKLNRIEGKLGIHD